MPPQSAFLQACLRAARLALGWELWWAMRLGLEKESMVSSVHSRVKKFGALRKAVQLVPAVAP